MPDIVEDKPIPETKLPYSDKVEEIYNAVDDVFVSKLNDTKPSFTEIEIVLMLLRAKYEEEKVKAYLKYFMDEEVPKKEDTSNMYK
jgi:hypothetical protein